MDRSVRGPAYYGERPDPPRPRVPRPHPAWPRGQGRARASGEVGEASRGDGVGLPPPARDALHKRSLRGSAPRRRLVGAANSRQGISPRVAPGADSRIRRASRRGGRARFRDRSRRGPDAPARPRPPRPRPTRSACPPGPGDQRLRGESGRSRPVSDLGRSPPRSHRPSK